MKNIILALFLFTVISISAQEPATEGIKFNVHEWTEALKSAKTGKKLIMLDAYTSWCGPCKMMAKTVFTQKSVGDFYNKNFVCIKIDMEKGEGIELAKKFQVTAYPTFLFVDENGNVVKRVLGYQKAEDFIKSGKEAQSAAKSNSKSKK
jgi:thioredoxin 1